MPRWKKGGYVFILYEGDHPPRHLHVMKDGRILDHFDLDHGTFMYGTIGRHRGRVLAVLRELGFID